MTRGQRANERGCRDLCPCRIGKRRAGHSATTIDRVFEEMMGVEFPFGINDGGNEA